MISGKKVLYLDCTSGISGDMTLAALLDLGIDEETFRNELKKIEFGGYKLEIKKIEHHSIKMMDIDVILDNEKNEEPDGIRNDGENYDHQHVSSHTHDHEHRNLKMITEIIDASTISENAKQIGKKIFDEIAKAEGKVHGKSVEQVHFHEVGAIDSLVDIMGVAICIDLLGIEEIYASPLYEGRGMVKCRHGILPVPVPAVAAILSGSGIPIVQGNADTELITPTGAGIAKCLVKEFGKRPPIIIEKVGYGHGKRETGLFGAVTAFLGTLYE
ncbi:MAG: LarC family nickel insertion protein [Lachnospiraceae bacterium]|nr:LarC family nickel insertion protein [Lachnospiraceae bacterium]